MPELALDDELRAAMFAHVQQLRGRYGDRIPREALMAGVTLRGTRVPIWNYQKGIFKPAALGRDGAALSVQTSAESPYEDSHDAETGQFIYKYRGTNAAHPDNVALRRAMELERPLLYLFAVDPGFYDAVFPVYATGDDVDALQFTLMADQVVASHAATFDALAGPRREYVTRAVMQRLHQQQFRRLVLGAYRNQCAICRLRHVALLDAAHILPDRDPRGAPVVTNGLGLCKMHHAAYDVHIVGIDADARVHVRTDILDEIDGPMLRHGLQEMHGSLLALPRREAQWPDPAHLAERFERFQAA